MVNSSLRGEECLLAVW